MESGMACQNVSDNDDFVMNLECSIGPYYGTNAFDTRMSNGEQ